MGREGIERRERTAIPPRSLFIALPPSLIIHIIY
jgi:hypothetical protein